MEDYQLKLDSPESPLHYSIGIPDRRVREPTMRSFGIDDPQGRPYLIVTPSTDGSKPGMKMEITPAVLFS